MRAALPSGDRILLDSTMLIAYLDGTEVVSPAAQLVVDDFVRSGRNPAVVSMVSVMEVLVGPAKASPVSFRHAGDFLQNFPNVQLRDIDFAVAEEAAAVRANHGHRAPDALIIATGLVAQVPRLVCNDLRWRNVKDKRLRAVILKDHVPL